MARIPSKRRTYKPANLELNLTPMMNLVGILIPVLLVSIAFIKIATIDVDTAGNTEGEGSDRVRLSLKIVANEHGISIHHNDPEARAHTHFIEATRIRVKCALYEGTVPPPRALNRDQDVCSDAGDERTFWRHDVTALRGYLAGLKENFPEERSAIISARGDVEFEAIVEIMDAAREFIDRSGRSSTLFDHVMVAPNES